MTQIISTEEIANKNEHTICQKCLMLDGPFGVHLNSEGICSICEDPTYETPTWKKTIINESLRQEKREEWDNLIRYWQEEY
ncbi:MAG: hypothetical protein ACFFE4_22680, partial [Candidatus Thorarchaeota archaeon]